jgi:pimeloyl-ACP methyl ester carboxylesterase
VLRRIRSLSNAAVMSMESHTPEGERNAIRSAQRHAHRLRSRRRRTAPRASAWIHREAERLVPVRLRRGPEAELSARPLDARGHGESDKPHDPAAYALALRVGDVVAVLDSLAIEKAHYWGYSMGGWIGFGMAKYAPERLHSLVIGGAHPYERKLPPSSRLDGAEPDASRASLCGRLGIDMATIPAAFRQDSSRMTSVRWPLLCKIGRPSKTCCPQ